MYKYTNTGYKTRERSDLTVVLILDRLQFLQKTDSFEFISFTHFVIMWLIYEAT